MTSLLNKLLFPGIHVMQNGRFFKKMAILVTIMLVPMILLTYLLHSEIRKTIDFAAGERAGVRYLLPLSEILIELSRDISPEINTTKLTQQAAIIEQNDAKLTETLKTAEAWRELKPLLQQQNVEQRQAAIEKTIELMAVVGDNSGLVLDPDIDSYYLMDAAVVKYPTILHKTNQMAYLATTTHGANRSVDEQIHMAMANGAVRSTLESVQTGIQKVEAANPAIIGVVTAFNESNAATEKLLVLANPVGVTAEQPLKAESLRVQLAQTTEQNAMAYRLYLKDLDELLAQRIERGQVQERNIFIIVLVVLLLAGYLLLALYFSMKKSIVNIFAATQLFAKGDWRSRVAVASADELGDIAGSLNEVRSQIHPMVSEIMQSAEKVMGASKELTANAGQVAQVANQMASAVSEMSDGAGHQLSAVHKSNNAIREVMAGIERVAANTNLVTIAANKTANAAEQGTSTVNTAVQQMHSIETVVGHSAEVVDKLGARSQEIGQIVNTISGIAAQTNLLALNAAIEAARAGEQGRGFAVVAEEVRQLAEESQVAAKQIAGLIAEIQRDTVNAVETMQSGTDVVQVGSKVVRSAGDSFKEIVQLIREEAEEIRDISATLAQIMPQTQTALSAADEIVSVSNAAVEQTQSVSAAGEEHSASMQEIASSSHELAALAEKLQQSVKSFQL